MADWPGLPSEGVPYPIFTFAALLPWQLFSFALTNSSNSLVNEKNLITKVYFPRIIIPFSSVVAGLLDFLIALGIYLILMLVYQIPLTWRVLWIPVFVLIAIITAVSVGLWLTTLNVKYRDVRYVIPFLTQFWMYATPIAYSSSLIPEKWMWLYSLNPMVGVVDGFRWMLIGNAVQFPPFFFISLLVVLIILGQWFYLLQKNRRYFCGCDLMSDIAIRVENLGKKYKIGANQARYQTLRESIVNGFSNSIERIKGAHPKMTTSSGR